MEIMSEINDIGELPAVAFLINLKIIYLYLRKDPRLMDKYKNGK